MSVVVKAATEVLDWKFEFDTYMLASAETISSHTVTVDTGIAKDSSALTDTNQNVLAWLSGGTRGKCYRATCTVVTSAGRTFVKVLDIEVI